MEQERREHKLNKFILKQDVSWRQGLALPKMMSI